MVSIDFNQTRLDPPETIRKQINPAESAFRKGKLDRALATYTRAIEELRPLT